MSSLAKLVRRPAVVIIAVGVVTLVAGLAIVGVKLFSRDERAYPGSDRGTLEEGLRWAHVALPACAEHAVRYAAHSDGVGFSSSFYLRLSVPRPCAEDFLALNRFTGSATVKPARFVSTVPAEWGWPRNAAKQFSVIDVDYATTTPLDVDVATDLDAEPADVFVRVGNA
ncbi:hypothetical protein ABT297_16010 [Dactylosporangium sp. NPDC000555]|uniref:hypothetical protein n=1 Tax=Dactylosporangium sp. NPDC000555 TaxID=3154260 RepID=UPI00331CC6B4